MICLEFVAGVSDSVIAGIDHVVLTTRDEARCLAFYVDVLDMRLERYGEGRIALRFGCQTINVHQPGVMAGQSGA